MELWGSKWLTFLKEKYLGSKWYHNSALYTNCTPWHIFIESVTSNLGNLLTRRQLFRAKRRPKQLSSGKQMT